MSDITTHKYIRLDKLFGWLYYLKNTNELVYIFAPYVREYFGLHYVPIERAKGFRYDPEDVVWLPHEPSKT